VWNGIASNTKFRSILRRPGTRRDQADLGSGRAITPPLASTNSQRPEPFTGRLDVDPEEVIFERRTNGHVLGVTGFEPVTSTV
jgi:hypothetical protein